MIFPGYQVIEAATGAEAVALTQARSPGVVLMDFILPDMNGLEAAARLGAITPAPSVVILTDCEVEKQVVRSQAKGTSAFVVIKRVTELRSTLALLLTPQSELIGS
jgi:CheY-like chemotaxis protein